MPRCSVGLKLRFAAIFLVVVVVGHRTECPLFLVIASGRQSSESTRYTPVSLYGLPVVIRSLASIMWSSNGRRLLHAATAGILLLLVDGRPIQFQSTAVKLIDRNFEHQTQASTGQTTGSWLIWFYPSGDTTVLDGDLPETDFWTEHNVVLASAHKELSRETVERLSLTYRELPCFVFLHNRKLYHYHGPLDWQVLQDFVVGGYQDEEAHDVPPPKSEWRRAIETLQKSIAGHVILAGLVVVFLAFVIYTLAVVNIMAPQKQKAS